MFDWIIHHIIGNIPVATWPIIAGVAVISYFLTELAAHFPTVSAYTFPIKIICIAVTVLSVFLWGGAGVTTVWQEDIKHMQEKVAEAEVKSHEVNTVIQTQVVTKIKKIKEKADDTNRDIETQRNNINADCHLSDDAWMLYNRSVSQDAVASSTGRVDNTSK
jgi:uncharacterized membrane protein (DUF106 family)